MSSEGAPQRLPVTEDSNAGSIGAVEPVPDARLPGWTAQWFAALGGQIAWAAAVLIAYPLVQVGCELGQTWFVHLPRWIAMAIGIAATLVGIKVWKVSRAVLAAGTDAPKKAQRAAFMGLGGAMLSGSAVFILFIEDIATWVIDPCL